MLTIPEITEEVKARFFTYVRKGDGCWEWTAVRLNKKASRAYGRFTIHRRQYLAHRVSWTISNGPIPPLLGVLHRCDNPQCVNPDHLFLGTHVDNMRDMWNKGKGAPATGDRNGSRTHPERVPRGDASGARKHPERIPRGDSHGLRIHPEARATGMRNGAYTHPEHRPKGESHGCSVLTWDKVREIREKYKPQKYSSYRLALEYKVSRSTIGFIVRNKTWIE